jgi:quinol monooxygenase YgiN
MTDPDTCVTLVPYFKIRPGQVDAWKANCAHFVSKTKTEPKCLHYAFSFDGDTAHCREGYVDADGVLAHLGNIDAELKAALAISDIVRLEVHGPAAELDKLRGPLGGLNPQWFTLGIGFRK